MHKRKKGVGWCVWNAVILNRPLTMGDQSIRSVFKILINFVFTLFENWIENDNFKGYHKLHFLLFFGGTKMNAQIIYLHPYVVSIKVCFSRYCNPTLFMYDAVNGFEFISIGYWIWKEGSTLQSNQKIDKTFG